MGRGSRFLRVLSRTLHSWSEDNAYRLSAALAYYAVFSIAPVLIIAIAVAGAVFGTPAARGQIFDQLAGLIGAAGASAISGLLASAGSSGFFNTASIAGFVTLFIGATGVFVALQDGLNTIWRVKARSQNVIYVFLRQRVFTFLLVLGLGALLFGSLVASAALSALGALSGSNPNPAWFWRVADSVGSFFVVLLLFGLVFKVVPDVYVRWRDAFAGAAVAAALFTAGKMGIGYYLGHSGFSSIYGAAGALVLVLAWVYYSSLILFFGAEFTAACARDCGRAVVPKPHAVLMTAQESIEQGLEPRRNPPS